MCRERTERNHRAGPAAAGLLVLAACALGLFSAAPDTEKSERIRHILGSGKTTVVPETFLRSFDPVTVFFDHPVGPESGGPADRPGQLLVITPAHPGEFRFLDSRTLQFRPAVAWPALSTFTVTAEGRAVRLSTLMQPPARIEPEAGSSNLGPISDLDLYFAIPLQADKLAAMISFRISPLPGVSDSRPTVLTSRDFVIKQYDQASLQDPVHYRVSFAKPVGFGAQLTLQLRLAADERIAGSLQSYSFSTRPRFKVTGIGSGATVYPTARNGSLYALEQAINVGSEAAPLFVEFSDAPAALSIQEVKRLVRFEPAVRDLTFELSGNRLALRFQAEPEKAYRVFLRYLPIRNGGGDVLEPLGPTSVYFYFRRPPPYVQWLNAQGILERFGPQMLPLEGRQVRQADVRIYKIDPLDQRFWPFPDQPLEVDEESRPAAPGEEPELVERDAGGGDQESGEWEGEEEEGEEGGGDEAAAGDVDSGYLHNMAENVKLAGSPLVSRLLPFPLPGNGRKTRFGLDLKQELARISGAEAPGTYLVGYRLLGEGRNRLYARVQVTDLDLTVVEEEAALVFVVTSLRSGEPLANARVWIEAGDTLSWSRVVEGTTDAQGRFRYVHRAAMEERIRRVVARFGEDTLVIDPQKAPPEFVDNHWYPSHSSWLGWLADDPRHERNRPQRLAHVLTERPVYRPEEPVHIKGYIRTRQSGRILPDRSGHPASLAVIAPGDKRWTFPVKLNPYGAFYQKFAAEDLPTGEYRAEIVDDSDGAVLARVPFRMESYRIPSFEIKLSGPEETGLDAPFKVTLTASYYAGGRVAGQQVDWKVTQFLYRPALPAYLGFSFSSDERFSSNRPFSTVGNSSRQDVTDENGASVLPVDPTVEEDGRARRYVIEATVRGADEMTVTSAKEVLALPPFFLGLKTPRLAKSIAELKPEVLVLGVDRRPRAGMAFHVRVFRREWHSYLQESDFTTGQAKTVSDVVDKPIQDLDLTSTGQAQPLALNIRDAGVYVVEVSAHDRIGRLIRVSRDFYLAGEKAVAWKKPTASIFETVADRPFYYPGQTARIALKSPFQNGRALVVVEGPEQNQYRWLEVSNGQALFELPIQGDMTPRLPVHFLLMRGRLPGRAEPGPAGGEDRAKPLAMGNTTWLTVKPKANELKVELEHPGQCLPAARVTVRIKLSDPDGQPQSGEVALWLVDRAVLALGKEARLDPLPSLITDVESALRLRDTRNQTVGNVATEEAPGGDGGAEEESLFDNITVRKNFKTVPYYNPSIEVKNGTAEIAIDLPDNLTEFAVRAVATNGRERFGSAKSLLAVRLPLLVQPALPRFVRPGDSFQAGGIGRVVEGTGGSGRAEIQVQGLRLEGSGKLALQWVKDRAEKLLFSLALPLSGQAPGGQVTVRLAVVRDADGAKDAFEVKLPVRPDVQLQQLETFATVEKKKTIAFPAPAEPVRPGSLRQQVVVSPEAAVIKMLAALDYLARYEYGCTEQRISKVLPELALKDLFNQIGRDDRGRVVDHSVRETLTYLETVLTPNGLYSYWPGSTGYVSLTAYVTEFLLTAQKLGYNFRKELLERPLQALKESLRSDYSHFIDGCSWIERVEALQALAKAGRYDPAYAFELQAKAASLDLYSQAGVLQTFLDHDRSNRRPIEALSAILWKSLVFKLRDGKEVYQGLQYRADAINGLILPSEVKTMAGVARSLYQLDPGNPRVALLFAELVSRGEGDGWGSTNANASALLALAQMVKQPDPRRPGERLEVRFGDKTEVLDTAGKLATRLGSAAATPGVLRHLEGGNGERPTAWMTVEYLPATTGDRLKERSSGFAVERELLTVMGPGRPPVRNRSQAGQTLEYDMGTVVEEHVRVVNPEPRNYVAISVPFAAGFEPLNPNLDTAPPEARPDGQLTAPPSYTAYDDDQVTFFYDTLPKGSFDFYFRLRASFAGSFSHPPAQAGMMYRLKVAGRSDGTRVVIRPRPPEK